MSRKGRFTTGNNQTNSQPLRKRLFFCALAVIFLTGSFTKETLGPFQGLFARSPVVEAAALSAEDEPQEPEDHRVYLPLITLPDPFYRAAPIWWQADPENASEVVLFRYPFVLSEQLEQINLRIFADTRYEAWIDGRKVGRGPARFTQTYREVDSYAVDPLAPGKHVLAVMVQWAPNNRRSESLHPYLQALFTGRTQSGKPYQVSTSEQWRAMRSPAWQPDASPVHAWGLIGPTELLDLRLLPPDWFLPGYDDRSWAPAVIVDPTSPSFQPLLVSRPDPEWNILVKPEPISANSVSLSSLTYGPRSIPALTDQPITGTVVDAGVLSPGFQIGEVMPDPTGAYSLTFSAPGAITLTLETLEQSEIVPLSDNVLVDDRQITWVDAGETRPDVIRGTANILTGTHSIRFQSIPAGGLTYAISAPGSGPIDGAFRQGLNAGRRLLLANPISSPEAVDLQAGSAISATFQQMPAYLVIDLGRTVYGRVSAQVSGPAGAVLDVGWDERLLPGTLRPLPYPGSLHPEWNQVDSWTLDGTSRSITTLDGRGGRYLLVAAWGKGPVTIGNFQVLEERYPVTPRGSLKTSDSRLDAIWQVGELTTQVNMTDAYADPWREHGQWWGDSYVIDKANQVTFADRDLLRRGLLLMGRSFGQSRAPGMAPSNYSRHMIDYTMLWVLSVEEYTVRTGDLAVLREVYASLLGFMDYLSSLEHPETGLLDIPKSHWAESAYVDTLGLLSRYGQSTALNALYYEVLQKAAEIAARLGDVANADQWRSKAVQVRSRINQELYLPSEHRYASTIFEGKREPPTPHAQAWAITYGIPEAHEQELVVKELLELVSTDPANPNIEIYGMFWVLEALGKTGRVPEGLEIIRQYWGRALDLGATTWWEGFNAHRSFTGSLSHGWGSGPTWFLTTYLLGTRQTGPADWVVKPALCAIPWAEGVFPLEQGDLWVSWSCQADGLWSIDLRVPEGTHGEVILPSNPTVTATRVDGLEAGDGLTIPVEVLPDSSHVYLEAGRYLIRASQE